MAIQELSLSPVSLNEWGASRFKPHLYTVGSRSGAAVCSSSCQVRAATGLSVTSDAGQGTV